MRKSSIVQAAVSFLLVSSLAGCGGGGSNLGSSGSSNGGSQASATAPVTNGPSVSIPDGSARSGTLVVQIPLANARTVKADVASFRVTISQSGETIRSQEFTRAEVAATGQQIVFTDIPEGTYDVRILYLSAAGTELGHFDQILTVGADSTALIDNPGYHNSKPDFKTVRLLPDNESSGVPFFATGDFNNDGITDVVFSQDGTANGRLNVCIGTGDGYFQPALVLEATVDFLEQVVVADLDGDLNDDLAVSSDDSVTVFLGNGNGTFGLPTLHGLSGGEQPFALQTADLNGDTVPDLVTANLATGDATVLIGVGDGSFETPFNLDLGSSAVDVELADVNGDTVLDVVGTDYGSNRLIAWLGVGDGTFGTVSSFTVGNAPTAIASVDLNNDGFDDLACVNYAGESVTLLVSNGSGGYDSSTLGVGEFPVSVSFGDIDKDGLQDLVVGNIGGAKDFSVLLGATTTSFEPEYRVESEGAPLYSDLVDINEDTHLDLGYCQIGPNGVVFAFGGADGTFETPAPKVAMGTFLFDVESADFNNDGILDLVTADLSGTSVGVALGLSDGGFAAATQLTGISASREVAVGDINSDGNFDIVAVGSSGLVVFQGNGSGGFSAPTSLASGAAESVALKDVNNDGALDVLLGRAGSSAILLFLNNGNGQFAPPRTVIHSVSPSEMEVEDFNNDGNLDIATLDSGEMVGLMLGDGTGAFTQISLTAVPSSGFSADVNMSSGDLNGDGNMDLAVTLRLAGKIAVLPGNGNGSFGAPVELDFGYYPWEALCADINGDDLTDMVCTYSFIPGVGVRIANDDGTFQDPVFFLTGTSTYAATVADFNRDGALDVVTAEGAGSVSVLLSR